MFLPCRHLLFHIPQKALGIGQVILHLPGVPPGKNRIFHFHHRHNGAPGQFTSLLGQADLLGPRPCRFQVDDAFLFQLAQGRGSRSACSVRCAGKAAAKGSVPRYRTEHTKCAWHCRISPCGRPCRGKGLPFPPPGSSTVQSIVLCLHFSPPCPKSYQCSIVRFRTNVKAQKNPADEHTSTGFFTLLRQDFIQPYLQGLAADGPLCPGHQVALGVQEVGGGQCIDAVGSLPRPRPGQTAPGR